MKILPFIYYYKKQIDSYNKTVHCISMKEIPLMLPNFQKNKKKKCYVWQCCMVLSFVYGYRVTYILTCIGALQYTMLVFGFPSLHSLRQYIGRKCDYCTQNIYLYYDYIIQPLQYHIVYINTHLSVIVSYMSSSSSNS